MGVRLRVAHIPQASIIKVHTTLSTWFSVKSEIQRASISYLIFFLLLIDGPSNSVDF